jgi:effector-binding domain-containing protein
MNYECKLKQVEPQPVLSIRGHIPEEAIAATIGEYLGEVWQYVEANGGKFAGPPYTRYHSITDKGVELEAGLPVSEALAGRGRVQAGTLPGGEVVSTMHVGPYEQLPVAGAALAAWAVEHRRVAAGPNWEIYWTDPGEVKDPAGWKTEVIMPLKSNSK